jgi:hypothetical protein
LSSEDSERLDRAYRSLTEVRRVSALARAREIAQALVPREQEGSAEAPAPLRPPIEWWQVGGRRFDSTAELVAAHMDRHASNGPAFYHFRHAPASASTRKLARLSATASVVGFLAAIFAVLAALAAGSIHPSLAGLLSRAMPSTFKFAFIAVSVVAAGAAWFQSLGFSALAQREGTMLIGTLRLDGEGSDRKVLFIPSLPDSAPVDLAAHAQAPASASPAPERRSDDVMTGVVSMGALLLAAFAPLFIGDYIGIRLAAKKHAALGRVLGVSKLGRGAGFGLVLLAQLLLWVGAMYSYWAAAGLAVAAGALWGKSVLPRLRAAESAEEIESGQWWKQR